LTNGPDFKGLSIFTSVFNSFKGVDKYDEQVGDDVNCEHEFVGQHGIQHVVRRAQKSYHPAQTPHKHDAGHSYRRLLYVNNDSTNLVLS